jgi:phosphatidylserine decarboxylase
MAAMGWVGAAAVFAVVALAFLGFFRDPDRTAPELPGRCWPRRRAGDGDHRGGGPVGGSACGCPSSCRRWTCVNRAPIGGLVKNVEYVAGSFLAAYRPEASERNERCAMSLDGDRARATVTQISGVLARRIVCRVRPGDVLRAGERYGLIRFGSRTDLVLPRGTDVRVRVGEGVRGGEAVMGVLR